MDWYNGYSPAERSRGGHAVSRALQAGTLVAPAACMLCGDPAARLELHSEDYSRPYLFVAPAAYWLCRACHRNNLHKRFSEPVRWQVFLAHIRRGGYASDLKRSNIKSELAEFRAQVAEDGPHPLIHLRDSDQRDKWWEQLTLDQGSLRNRACRPRPEEALRSAT